MDDVVSMKEFAGLLQSYLFSASPFFHPLLTSSLLSSTALSLLQTAAKTLYHLLILILLIVIMLLKLLTISFPYFINACQTIIHFHRTQLTPRDLAIEFSLLLTLLTIAYFKKTIIARYKAFESLVAAKSRSAAKVLPHFTFFSISITISIVGRKFLAPLAYPSIMPLFTLIAPILMTIPHSSLSKDKLAIWVLLFFYHSVATLLSFLPYSSYMSYYLPFMREMVLVVAIWVQLSPVFTHIVLESFEPFILHITKKIPSIDIGFTSTLDVIAFWLEKRGLSSYYVSILKGFLTEASTLVAVLFFCFTPTPIASIGVVIVCMLIPLTRSADILTQLKYSKSKKTEATLEPLILFLLHYWVCLALVWLARLYILSPWPSVLLITCLWLQNSYFKGASRLVKEARALTIMLVERNAQQVIALVEGEDDDVSGKALQTPVATPSSAKGRSLRDSEEKISPIAVDADDATGIKSMSELSSTPLSSMASTVRKRRSTRKKFTSPDGKDAD